MTGRDTGRAIRQVMLKLRREFDLETPGSVGSKIIARDAIDTGAAGLCLR